MRAARSRPWRRVEKDAVVQGKLAMAFRGAIAADDARSPAAACWPACSGAAPSSRLFKVVRETHGLCYYAQAGWARGKGLLLVQSGVEPKNEPKARKLILELFREVASGTLDAQAFEAVREAARSRVEAMRDERGLSIAFAQETTALGLDPRPEGQLRSCSRSPPPTCVARGARSRSTRRFFLTGGGA